MQVRPIFIRSELDPIYLKVNHLICEQAVAKAYPAGEVVSA